MLIALGVILLGAAAFFVLPRVIDPAYPLDKTDHISSWEWQGAYQDQRANVEQTIRDMQNQIGENGQDTYDLYVGIASEYELLGDGKNSYRYLSKAIAKDKKRGIAYLNMGHLMAELGAFETARKAYTEAAKVEPDNPIYQSALQAFLAEHP